MAVSTAVSVANSKGAVPDALSQYVGGLWMYGSMETDLPANYLNAYIAAIMGETVPDPGSANKNIIDANEPWQVDVYWLLAGSLRHMICGKWCVKLFLESLGKDDLDLELENDGGLIELNPGGSGLYHAHFTVKPDRVRVEHCGTPFQPVATVTYLSEYKVNPRLPDNDSRAYLPGPIAGFVSFPITQFFREGIEV
jgi:hypothetical protein